MNINKTDNSTNFGNFYKIPYSAKNLTELKNEVIPVYKSIRKRPVMAFVNPVHELTMDAFQDIAKSQNSSLDWLYANAKLHGINMPKAEDGKIFIVSTMNDCIALNNFIQKHNNKFARLKMILKSIFAPKELFEIPANTPEHLVPVYLCTQFTEKANRFFDEFYQKHKIIDVETPYKLFCKMMNEK